MLTLDTSILPANLRVGTSSFSAKDWLGVFYPEHLKPGDYLGHYAQQMGTVEIDATWHAMPSLRIVEGWAGKVPDDFVFALKVPKTITHEHYLEDCLDEWRRFLKLLEPLGDKRGPLLFQFPYIAKGKDADEYATGRDFQRRLADFLPHLPRDGRYVVEVRNEKWLGEPLLDILRSRGIALALVAYYTMPPPQKLRSLIDPATCDFGYVRFLGHHQRMDALVQKKQREEGKNGAWNELLVDRTAETRQWIELIRELLDRRIDVFAYFNNHFAGFAPGSIELFLQLWRREAFGA
jgi:uncharacterized protein YecE (DUF72 family)